MDDETTLLPGAGPRRNRGTGPDDDLFAAANVGADGGRRSRGGARGGGPGGEGPGGPGAGGSGPDGRRNRRRAEKATVTRNTRIRRASIVLGAVVAVVAAWALVGRPGLSLVTGDAEGGAQASGTPSADGSTGSALPTTGTTGSVGTPTGSVSPSRDPKLATLDSKLATGQPGAGGFTSSKPVVGLGAKGFAPICGGPAASDKLVLSAVTSTLKGSRAGGSVTIVQSQAVYSKGGVSALLAEAGRASCADSNTPLPNYPKGSVLLRGRGGAGEAYLVAPTSDNTALFIKASSSAEDAVVDTLFSVVPGLISQAQSNAATLEKSIP